MNSVDQGFTMLMIPNLSISLCEEDFGAFVQS